MPKPGRSHPVSTAVVVPCYNEAGRLDAAAFAPLAAGVDQVIFVDDGSTDATTDVLDGIVATLGESTQVVTLPENVGKGEAVRVGMLLAIERGADLVGFLDADLATPPAEMLRLVAIAERQPARTAVLGSRVALLGHTVRRRALRHYLGRVYATGASVALGVAVYDTQCGAKVFRVGTPLQFALADPFHDRWAFDVELLGRLLATPDQSAEPVLEVPLDEWNDVPGSSVDPLAAVRAFLSLASVRRRVREHRRRYA